MGEIGLIGDGQAGMCMYSRFLRKCAARGSSNGLCHKGPSKVMAHNSILFTEGSPEVERK